MVTTVGTMPKYTPRKFLTRHVIEPQLERPRVVVVDNELPVVRTSYAFAPEKAKVIVHRGDNPTSLDPLLVGASFDER